MLSTQGKPSHFHAWATEQSRIMDLLLLLRYYCVRCGDNKTKGSVFIYSFLTEINLFCLIGVVGWMASVLNFLSFSSCELNFLYSTAYGIISNSSLFPADILDAGYTEMPFHLLLQCFVVMKKYWDSNSVCKLSIDLLID